MKDLKPVNDNFIDFLSQVDETYAGIPDDVQLEIEELSKNLPRMAGERLGRRAGSGMESFGSRSYDPLNRGDTPQMIDFRLSAQGGGVMVRERELERRHRVSMWRNPAMSSAKKIFSEVCILGFGQKLVKDKDRISIIKDGELHQIGHNIGPSYDILQEVSIIDSDNSDIDVDLPRSSTVILFDEFFDVAGIQEKLENLHERQLNGYLVMLLDPSEAEFDLPDNVEIYGPSGEKTLTGKSKLFFGNTKSFEEEWFKKLGEHLRWLNNLCEESGFKLVLQRTDEPHENCLIQIIDHDFPHAAEIIPKLRNV